jgi:hypothetical protein
MDFIVNILMALGLLPAKDLADSMHQSKALTIMVIIGVVLFSCFVFFLFKMAGKE